eukprot:2177674-Karenia_brevis.AAC.1
MMTTTAMKIETTLMQCMSVFSVQEDGAHATTVKNTRRHFFARCAGKKRLPEAKYSHSQWTRCLERNAGCKDCLHPRCTNPNCKTCPRCHNSKCKVKSMQCKKVFEHTQSTLPQNEEELAT